MTSPAATRPCTRRPRRTISLISALASLAVFAVGPPATGADRGVERTLPPVVIAVVEPGGFNVLHSDFRLEPGQDLQVPSGLPARTMVTLPKGDWHEQERAVQEGSLGALEPGVLYAVAGTRILGIRATEGAAVSNIMEDRSHGTGTASSAVGWAYGTAPNAWLVYVPDVSQAAWRWVARQRWIDVVSTSYAASPDNTCASVDAIARIARQGRLVFTAVGNGEQAGTVLDPSGVPDAYQVGGVDEQGRPYLPLVSGGLLGTPNRPYETADSFDTEAASSSSLDAGMDFGGTSAAAPRTAGRAALLIQHSRALLGSSDVAPGVLAQGHPAAAIPRSGPLADGDLTGSELSDLMHAVAIPSLPPSALRYLYEGFGALDDDAVAHAKRILEGGTKMPDRSEDQATHEQVEALRELTTKRC